MGVVEERDKKRMDEWEQARIKKKKGDRQEKE